MVGMMNWKGLGRKQSWPNRGKIVFAERTRENLKTKNKNPDGTVGVPIEIRTATSRMQVALVMQRPLLSELEQFVNGGRD
jgi:hypothetical protein